MIATDIMTINPRTIRVTATIRAALEALGSLEVRHLPVVDDEGELVGMLSDRDLKAFDNGAHEGRTVGDVMSGGVVSVETDTDLEEVIETLLEQRIGAVPVVDGEGAVAGIISYVDVLRTYAGELAGNGKGEKRTSAAKKSGPRRAKKKSAPKRKSAPKKSGAKKSKKSSAPKKAAKAKHAR